jgi:hypothetical protein
MKGDVHPGSGSRILIFYSSRIEGSKRHRIPDPGPQHWYNYIVFKANMILRSHKTVEIKVAILLITDSDLDTGGPKIYISSGSGTLLMGYRSLVGAYSLLQG